MRRMIETWDIDGRRLAIILAGFASGLLSAAAMTAHLPFA